MERLIKPTISYSGTLCPMRLDLSHKTRVLKFKRILFLITKEAKEEFLIFWRKIKSPACLLNEAGKWAAPFILPFIRNPLNCFSDVFIFRSNTGHSVPPCAWIREPLASSLDTVWRFYRPLNLQKPCLSSMGCHLRWRDLQDTLPIPWEADVSFYYCSLYKP